MMDCNASDPALEDGTPAAASEACLVMIYGPDLGRRFEIDREEMVIGRDEACEVPVRLDTVSRRHCRLRRVDGAVLLADLGSTNGTAVNSEPLAPEREVALREGDRLRVGSAIFRFLCGHDVESLHQEEVHRTMIADGLTGAHTSRFLVETLAREMARCQRHGRPLSLVLFDVDHLERLNDDHGHLTGDSLLCQLGALVRSRVRREDCFARIGGGAFGVLLTEANREAACAFAAQLCEAVEAHVFVAGGGRAPLTISAGVAERSADMSEPTDFLAAAGARLAEAKSEGRNRVAG